MFVLGVVAAADAAVVPQLLLPQLVVVKFVELAELEYQLHLHLQQKAGWSYVGTLHPKIERK